MNPWEIFGWVAAICCALIVIAVTLTMIRAAIKPPQPPADRDHQQPPIRVL